MIDLKKCEDLKVWGVFPPPNYFFMVHFISICNTNTLHAREPLVEIDWKQRGKWASISFNWEQMQENK